MDLEKLIKNANSTLVFTLAIVDQYCEGYKPWQLIVYTSLTILAIVWTYQFLFQPEASLGTRTKAYFFRTVKRLPVIGTMIDAEMNKTKKLLSADTLFKLAPGTEYLQALPRKGYSESRVASEVDEYLKMDHVDWKEGKCSGTVYNCNQNLTNMISSVLKKFAWANPLHPDVFPSLRKMEAEVARMTCSMFHGDPMKSAGCVTTGGTESILLAVKAYRDWAYEKGIRYPEIVCPLSAHAAFEKAAHYFKLKIVHVPLDPKTWQVDIRKMRKAINRNTCMLVGSAPNFPHGIIDPIKDIAALGEKYGIPVHVDACLGGFLIAFMEDAGFPLEPFDFRVPGVTSISADTHKYGFTPKGTSCILYSSSKWRRYQYFVADKWQGGLYTTPTLGGSRAGLVIAATWATMVKFGHDGYVSTTRSVISATRYITDELSKIDHIHVFGNPQVCVVAIGSLDFDIFRLQSALVDLNWNFSPLQHPSAIHIACTMLHTKPGVADKIIFDIKRSVKDIMKDPKQKITGAAAMYGMAQSIPDQSILSELACSYVDAVYDTTHLIKKKNNNYHTQNGFL